MPSLKPTKTQTLLKRSKTFISDEEQCSVMCQNRWFPPKLRSSLSTRDSTMLMSKSLWKSKSNAASQSMDSRPGNKLFWTVRTSTCHPRRKQSTDWRKFPKNGSILKLAPVSMGPSLSDFKKSCRRKSLSWTIKIWSRYRRKLKPTWRKSKKPSNGTWTAWPVQWAKSCRRRQTLTSMLRRCGSSDSLCVHELTQMWTHNWFCTTRNKLKKAWFLQRKSNKTMWSN